MCYLWSICCCLAGTDIDLATGYCTLYFQPLYIQQQNKVIRHCSLMHLKSMKTFVRGIDPELTQLPAATQVADLDLQESLCEK